MERFIPIDKKHTVSGTVWNQNKYSYKKVLEIRRKESSETMNYRQKAQRLLQIPKKRLIRKALGFDEIYTIAIRERNGESLWNGGGDSFYCIPYSRKYWFADPLTYLYQNADYLFVEAYDRTIARGHIAVAEMDEPGKMVFQSVIKEEYHMSFPMVFSWGKDIYMIPETSENFSINIYRAREFPFQWECVKQFKTEQKMVDTVLLKEENNRGIFLASEVNPCNPLEVRYQKFLLQYGNNDWALTWDDAFNLQQHFNLRDRNAGKCFADKKRLLLPTQISTDIDYGVKLSFKELSGDTWREIRDIAPDDVVIKGVPQKNIIGIHTYSSTDRWEVIDVRYMKFSPVRQWKKLIKR